VVAQGELYWVDFGEPLGSEPAFIRPAVVVQNDASNETNMATVIVCPLTSNLGRRFPGAVLLEEGEGSLGRPSLVEVWAPMTLSGRALGDYIGTLSSARVFQIARGIVQYLDPTL
jgi:mRNA interferase MazF